MLFIRPRVVSLYVSRSLSDLPIVATDSYSGRCSLLDVGVYCQTTAG
jgi:hypothetical protein